MLSCYLAIYLQVSIHLSLFQLVSTCIYPLVVKKYIDDVSGVEKIHASHLYQSKTNEEGETRYIHAVQAQALFDRVRVVAAEKGMKLNPSKTVLLAFSAATSYHVKTYINCEDGLILSGKKCRLLGFHFDGKPGVEAHVSEILRKVRYRTWAIHNLKRLGLCPAGLLSIYTSLVRPCFDFSCVVYHSLLTKTQSAALERMQRKILKIIYGFDVSYANCLAKSGLDELSYRRQRLCESFALKTAMNPRFSDWFPMLPDTGYDLRDRKKYKEFPARTERLRSAPIYLFRCQLNNLSSEGVI